MSYEARINLQREGRITVYGHTDDPFQVSFHYHAANVTASAFITADQARELAHALLDAAQEAEPQAVVEVTA